MFARLPATFCLITLAVVRCWAADLVVYLRTDPLQSPHPVETMKRELAPLMLSAGYRVEWRDSQAKNDASTSELVVLELRGVCGMPAGTAAADIATTDSKDLASTSASGDRVLPFTSINCAGLTHLLAPSLAAEAGMRRDFLYGRAMARLMAHELYHVLAKTRDHDREGIAKAHFTFSDLLTEHFEFEPGALARLRLTTESVGESSSVADAPTGR